MIPRLAIDQMRLKQVVRPQTKTKKTNLEKRTEFLCAVKVHRQP